MAKLEKAQFMEKYHDKLNEINDIELIEDISDSLDIEDQIELNKVKEELEVAHSELEESKTKYLELEQKYKERFFSAVAEEDKEEIDEPTEVDVIDVKEL